MTVITTPRFWECECADRLPHIHHKSVDHCAVCGADRWDSPDARPGEVLEAGAGRVVHIRFDFQLPTIEFGALAGHVQFTVIDKDFDAALGALYAHFGSPNLEELGRIRLSTPTEV